MTIHKTGTREEWLRARLELLKEKKELTRRSDELAKRRQELPWVRIDKEYRFETATEGVLCWQTSSEAGRSSSSTISCSGRTTPLHRRWADQAQSSVLTALRAASRDEFS